MERDNHILEVEMGFIPLTNKEGHVCVCVKNTKEYKHTAENKQLSR